MQTAIGRPTNRYTIPPYYRGGGESQSRTGSRTQEADLTAMRCGHDFLKSTINAIAPKKIEWETSAGTVDLITEENYRYLLDSACNYAGLIGRKLVHIPGHSLCESIAKLYKELDKLTAEEVNFEVDQNRLTFCLYRYHRWPDWTFHWLPVSFIDILTGKLKRIAISFIHEFALHNGMTYLTDNDDLDWTIDWMAENAASGEFDKKERRGYRGAIRSYINGHARHLLERVERRCYYKRLPQVLDRYQPVNEYEELLAKLFKEGFQFVGHDKPSIMHYLYDPYDETQESDMIRVDPDRMIRVVYDVDDVLNENLSEMVNTELQNCDYIITPATTLYLTPDLKKPFSMDDYPERFSKWIERFVEFITTHNP